MKLSDSILARVGILFTIIGGLTGLVSLGLNIYDRFNLNSLKDVEQIFNNNEPAISTSRLPKPTLSISTRLQQFKTLINQNVVFSSDKPNVALIIESKNSKNGLSPGNELANLLKSDRYYIIKNLFNIEALTKKGFIAEFLKGKTEILVSSGVISPLHHLVIGKLQFSFRCNSELDGELVSCDILFTYQVIDSDGQLVKSESINNVIGAGFSDDAALRRGLEILAENYSDQILSL